jgi:hypothetical protein
VFKFLAPIKIDTFQDFERTIAREYDNPLQSSEQLFAQLLSSIDALR